MTADTGVPHVQPSTEVLSSWVAEGCRPASSSRSARRAPRHTALPTKPPPTSFETQESVTSRSMSGRRSRSAKPISISRSTSPCTRRRHRSGRYLRHEQGGVDPVELVVGGDERREIRECPGRRPPAPPGHLRRPAAPARAVRRPPRSVAAAPGRRHRPPTRPPRWPKPTAGRRDGRAPCRWRPGWPSSSAALLAGRHPLSHASTPAETALPMTAGRTLTALALAWSREASPPRSPMPAMPSERRHQAALGQRGRARPTPRTARPGCRR